MIENKLTKRNKHLTIHNDVEYISENIIWSGKPSQLMNIYVYFISVFLIAFITYLAIYFNNNMYLYSVIVPFFLVIWSTLKTYCTVYILTNERIIKKYGVFNRYTFDIELYRVKDVKLVEPFIFRFFYLGNIRLLTSQRSLKFFYIPAMKNPIGLRNNLRILVEKRRNQKRVRELDTN